MKHRKDAFTGLYLIQHYGYECPTHHDCPPLSSVTQHRLRHTQSPASHLITTLKFHNYLPPTVTSDIDHYENHTVTAVLLVSHCYNSLSPLQHTPPLPLTSSLSSQCSVTYYYNHLHPWPLLQLSVTVTPGHHRHISPRPSHSRGCLRCCSYIHSHT